MSEANSRFVRFRPRSMSTTTDAPASHQQYCARVCSASTTHPSIPAPESAAISAAFGLDDPQHPLHTLVRLDDPLDIPVEIDVRHIPVSKSACKLARHTLLHFSAFAAATRKVMGLEELT
jgi:hypothetical protein